MICARVRPLSSAAAHIQIELVVVAHRGERGDGDQAAIPHTEIGPPPQVVEHDVVGELRELRRDRAQFIVHGLARAASEPGAGRRGPAARSAPVSTFRAVYTCS